MDIRGISWAGYIFEELGEGAIGYDTGLPDYDTDLYGMLRSEATDLLSRSMNANELIKLNAGAEVLGSLTIDAESLIPKMRVDNQIIFGGF